MSVLKDCDEELVDERPWETGLSFEMYITSTKKETFSRPRKI